MALGQVAWLVGDGVEVGLVAGDGGSFGQVSADEPVGVFVSSSLPGAVGVSEEHLHAGVAGEALVAGGALNQGRGTRWPRLGR